MATMTMSARGTPSLNHSLTPNTAPVHEHRCLFSRDAHKKETNRSYHDGTLKFHTFNSRVMVYDLDRHFVGDLHYRGDEEFGEGLTIKLDRSVIVEVQERLGETQTDLEQVLHSKNRDVDTNPHDSPVRSKPVRLLASASQKPRSLKDVLGTSQSQLQRARMQYQSPYEQRHALTPIQSAEPPNKRQKLAPTGKENGSSPEIEPAKTLSPQRPVPPNKAAPTMPKPKSNAAPPSSAVIEHQAVHDLSSDDENRPLCKPVQLKSTTVKIMSKERRVLVNKPSRKSKAVSAKEPTKLPTNGKGGSERAAQGSSADNITAPASCRTPKLTPNVARLQLKALSGSSGVMLSLPTQKPRAKLMYRKPLPETALAQKPSPTYTDHAPEPSVERSGSPSSKHPCPTKQSLDEALEELYDLNECIEKSPPRAESSIQPDKLSTLTMPPYSSPLFMPNDDAILPSSSQPHGEDNFKKQILGAEDIDNELREPQPSVSSGIAEGLASLPSSGASSPPPAIDTTSEFAEIASPAPQNRPAAAFMLSPALPTSRSPHMARLSPSRERPFRRVLSENDAPVSFSQDVPDEDFLQLKTQLPPQKGGSVSGATPSKLRRTTSDSAVIGNEPDPAAVRMSPIPEVIESGPWTSLEAFLLFDTWPTAKDRPYYGQVTTPEKDLYMKPALGGITTAGAMLRDDVNAL